MCPFPLLRKEVSRAISGRFRHPPPKRPAREHKRLAEPPGRRDPRSLLSPAVDPALCFYAGSCVTPSWGGDRIVIHFTINGREFESDRRHVRAAWLAEQAGLDPTGFELVRTRTGETWRDPSAAVKLREGDAFDAKGRPRRARPSIRYTVNGERQVTKESP